MTLLTLFRPPQFVEVVVEAATNAAAGRLDRCRRTVARWVARSRQRRALREIAERNDDRHLLKDIGLSQEEAFREADKPFWRS